VRRSFQSESASGCRHGDKRSCQNTRKTQLAPRHHHHGIPLVGDQSEVFPERIRERLYTWQQKVVSENNGNITTVFRWSEARVRRSFQSESARGCTHDNKRPSQNIGKTKLAPRHHHHGIPPVGDQSEVFPERIRERLYTWQQKVVSENNGNTTTVFRWSEARVRRSFQSESASGCTHDNKRPSQKLRKATLGLTRAERGARTDSTVKRGQRILSTRMVDSGREQYDHGRCLGPSIMASSRLPVPRGPVPVGARRSRHADWVSTAMWCVEGSIFW